MVIHPNAGWAGVIWGRSKGGKGVGGGGRVAAGWGASGDSGAVRHKNENNFYRNKIVSKFVIFLRHVYGYTYALLYGGPVGLHHALIDVFVRYWSNIRPLPSLICGLFIVYLQQARVISLTLNLRDRSVRIR